MGEDITFKQFYWPETNILVTRFLSTHGAAQITDYMPAGRAEGETGYGWVVRHLHVVWGQHDVCARLHARLQLRT